jgi:ribosomal protein S18 acetylase RimI-like enzyme
MPRLQDKNSIRQLLLTDVAWCVYAIGDLTPRMFAKCQWFTPDLTLVLHDYGTCILFAHGTGSIREAMDHVSWPVHLQVQRAALDEIKLYAAVTEEKRMLRMAADLSALARSAKVDDADAKRLAARDIDALRRLYGDGEATGESPDFFYDSMVDDGVFFGIYEGADLIAAAGTHLVSRDEGAAAIGNVYVRRDRRGRGRSRIVTAAVLGELHGVGTIGLNVRADNAAAIRVYESLGFVTHCPFYEALAHKPGMEPV